MPEKDFAPGSFGCHEALHVASMLSDMVDRELCDHPAIQQSPEWKAKADAALSALCDLYQMIGAKHVSGDADA